MHSAEHSAECKVADLYDSGLIPDLRPANETALLRNAISLAGCKPRISYGTDGLGNQMTLLKRHRDIYKISQYI